MSPAVLEHVHEEAAGHAGSAAGDLPHSVQQTSLDGRQSQRDVDLGYEHQEGPAIHVLQRVSAITVVNITESLVRLDSALETDCGSMASANASHSLV